LKNDVNVPPKSTEQKILEFFFCVLKVTDEKSRIRIRFIRSADLDPYQNVRAPEHWEKVGFVLVVASSTLLILLMVALNSLELAFFRTFALLQCYGSRSYLDSFGEKFALIEEKLLCYE
jgi:hypothetical protein